MLSVCTAHATEPPPERELGALSLEELMDVRVRSATLVSQKIETVPSVISVITTEQIRALGLRTLGDALQLLPGVSVLDTQLGEHQVAIRGVANANDVLVTLDGERLNDFYDGTFLLDYPLENIERIELIRGPGSAIYGTNAFAGVISLYSMTKAELFAGLGGETYLDRAAGWGVRAHGKMARSTRGWTFRLFGSYWETSGPKVSVERDNADPSYSLAPGVTRAWRRLAVAQLSIVREGLLARKDTLELWAAFLYRRHGPYFGPNNVLAPDSDLARSSLHTFLEYRLPLPRGIVFKDRVIFDRRDEDNLVQTQPSGYFHETDGNFTREPGELFPDGKLRRFSFATYRLAIKPQVSWDLVHPRGVAGNSLIIGAEVEYSWLPSFDYGQNSCCGDNYLSAGPTLRNYDNLPLPQRHKDRLIMGGFLHDQLQVLKSLWITVGMRFDRFSDFGFTWNPRAAVVWRAHRKLSFKLLYGRAFRAPSFQDLYDQTGVSRTAGGLVIEGNPKLQPETTNTAELGVETAPWKFLTLRANGFYIRESDVIEVDTTFSVGGAKLINFPGVQIWGGEAEAQLHIDAHNYLSGNLSYFNSTQIGGGLPGFESNPDRAFLDMQLNDLPRLRANAVLVTRPLGHLQLPAPAKELTLGFSYRYVAATANNNRTVFEVLNVFQQPSYHELTGNVVVPFLRGRLDVNASFATAINRTIAVPLMNGWYDLPTSHLNFFVGLRVHD